MTGAPMDSPRPSDPSRRLRRGYLEQGNDRTDLHVSLLRNIPGDAEGGGQSPLTRGEEG